MWTRSVVGLVAVAALTVGCASDEQGDASARLACRGLRQTANDFDTLTTSELRDRVRGIDNDAKISDETAVRTAARDLMVAVTDGTESDQASAVAALDRACDSLGY